MDMSKGPETKGFGKDPRNPDEGGVLFWNKIGRTEPATKQKN